MMLPACTQPENCKHYVDDRDGKNSDGYDWCHVCAMDHDCFVPVEETEIDNAQREYEAAVEYQQYVEMYEPTYDPETGAM